MEARFDPDDFLANAPKLLTSSDYVDIECSDCIGCTNSCCRELSSRITLDSWDIALLKKGLGMSFDRMVIEGLIAFEDIDGVRLPIFANKPEADECVFLGDDGRCTIHPFRAGICRMYPLARLWKEDGSFSYYLQKGECVHRTTARTKISDWLGYEDIEAYENKIREYHGRLKEYREACRCAKTQAELSEIQDRFFMKNFISNSFSL